jgi:DNA adenine methylase
MTTIVPPIKCQGIKTKLVPLIQACVPARIEGTWIEPFCGSCVVALNVMPDRAILTDANPHIIGFYQGIQSGEITASSVRHFLEQEGRLLSREGEAHYYRVRARFKESHQPLDFLFLSRACFNGVMRFNRRGDFNVPFCKKVDRFSPAYITKIANQVKRFSEVIRSRDWQFRVGDFRATLRTATSGDFVYADPPYIGRHVDYFNTWDETDEQALVALLRGLPCHFILSTWHSNEYRTNSLLQANWQEARFSMRTIEHFYHVGATEELRNAMREAIVANYTLPELQPDPVGA